MSSDCKPTIETADGHEATTAIGGEAGLSSFATSPLISPEDLTHCFDMLDAYHGPEAERTHWLANQFTSFSDNPTEAEWARLEAEASEIIGLWRAARRRAA